MPFDLTDHLTTQHRKSAADLIKEACRLITGCKDPHRRALAMAELRRMQALAR
jgi:hypothetical protein